MIEPNNPRLKEMLDVLADIYKSEDRPAAERLEAIDRSLQIMSRRVKKRKRGPKKDQSLENQLAAIRKLQSEKQ